MNIIKIITVLLIVGGYVILTAFILYLLYNYHLFIGILASCIASILWGNALKSFINYYEEEKNEDNSLTKRDRDPSH